MPKLMIEKIHDKKKYGKDMYKVVKLIESCFKLLKRTWPDFAISSHPDFGDCLLSNFHLSYKLHLDVLEVPKICSDHMKCITTHKTFNSTNWTKKHAF